MELQTILTCVTSIIVIIIVVGSIIMLYKVNAINYEEKVREAIANIYANEHMRADLLPNLVEAIKAYDQHEYSTLTDVIKARRTESGLISDSTHREIKSSILAIAEAYPELKSSENYRQYLNNLMVIENKLYQLREAYNIAVTRYNSYVRNPVHEIFLNITKYKVKIFDKMEWEVHIQAPKDIFRGS